MRANWLESRRELAFELHLYLPNTSLQQAYEMPESDVVQLLESKTFKKWQELANNDRRNAVLAIERTNDVIQAINNLSKLVAKGFSRR